jgi:hypothetical protein
MSDRLGFLLGAPVLLILGVYAVVNPHGVKRENADGPYFKTGLAGMPIWFFRAMGVVTVGMAAFFVYLFWTH